MNKYKKLLAFSIKFATRFYVTKQIPEKTVKFGMNWFINHNLSKLKIIESNIDMLYKPTVKITNFNNKKDFLIDCEKQIVKKYILCDTPTFLIYEYSTNVILNMDCVHDQFKKFNNDNNYRFFIISLVICEKNQQSKTAHLNVLLYDKKYNTLERFEPVGSLEVLIYKQKSLDDILEEHLEQMFNKNDIKYFKPKDYIPKYSFQYYDAIQTKKNRNGYCAYWTFYYLELRLSNILIDKKDLIEYSLVHINNRMTFSRFIQNYSHYVSSISQYKKEHVNIP